MKSTMIGFKFSSMLLLSYFSFASAQFCECDSEMFTDDYAGGPIDHYYSSSLIRTECGYECHPGGEFHLMPYFPWKSTKYGASSCVGHNFDFNSDGVAFCVYADDTSVLATSSTNCSIGEYKCDDCDFSQLRFFNDFHDVLLPESSPDSKSKYYQVLCKYGYLQVLFADGSRSEERESIWQKKDDCSIQVNEKDVVAVSCLHKHTDLDMSLTSMGGHPGLTGHCKFGQCWMYCEDYKKTLNYLPWGWMPRLNATNGFLNCQSLLCYDRGIMAFDVKCI